MSNPSARVLRGVSIGPWDIFQNTLVRQDFVTLKREGIQYVKIINHLGNLVEDDGSGNWVWKTSYKSGEKVIDTWLRYISWASDAGLSVTPDISLYGTGFGPWLNQNTFWDPSVYPKFASLWGTLAEIFHPINGVVSYHILHVPGHMGTGSRDDYDGIVTPTCIEAIRAKSGKTISWMPYLMGWKDYEGYPCQTGYYADAQPLPYGNIEYNFNHYADKVGGITDQVTHRCQPYDGNTDPLLFHLTPAIAFKRRHGVPMMCAEFGIKIGNCGGWPLVEPSRLLWVRDILELFRLYDFDWAYWNLAIPVGYGGDSWSIMNYDHTFRTDLVELLAAYVPSPILLIQAALSTAVGIVLILLSL